MQEVVWSRKRTIEKRFYFGCFIHESYTNFLKICIFAVARADTKSAKKRMVVRFFERRRQCVKYGEMGVIVPVVSTTQKDHPTGWSFLRGGGFCVGIDRNAHSSPRYGTSGARRDMVVVNS